MNCTMKASQIIKGMSQVQTKHQLQIAARVPKLVGLMLYYVMVYPTVVVLNYFIIR